MTKFRLRRVLAVVVASGLAAFLLAEVTLRWLLFGDVSLGEPLREPSYYAHWQSPEFRTLTAAFDRETRRHPFFDRGVGWTKEGLAPETYASADEERLGDRRPILFYGDSFTSCVTGPADCWEGLVDASELGRTHGLVNLGVGGYGLGQMLLLMRSTLDRFADRDPIVIVGILVDDDLDRSALPVRGFPKPYFVPEDGALTLRPLVHATAADYAAATTIGIRSYAWRLAVLGSGVLPDRAGLALAGEGALVAYRMELNRLLLEALREELTSRGLEHFFVVFHGRRAFRSRGPYTWREPFLLDTLDELGLPRVSSKRALRADAARTGRDESAYFLDEDPGANHYTPTANAVVFEALQRGLRGEYDDESPD